MKTLQSRSAFSLVIERNGSPFVHSDQEILRENLPEWLSRYGYTLEQTEPVYGLENGMVALTVVIQVFKRNVQGPPSHLEPGYDWHVIYRPQLEGADEVIITPHIRGEVCNSPLLMFCSDQERMHAMLKSYQHRTSMVVTAQLFAAGDDKKVG
jgi:hypothetical protein